MLYENGKSIYLVFAADSGEGIADAFLAVGGGEDVVDAGLDLLDRVQVAAVSHRLWEKQDHLLNVVQQNSVGCNVQVTDVSFKMSSTYGWSRSGN